MRIHINNGPVALTHHFVKVLILNTPLTALTMRAVVVALTALLALAAASDEKRVVCYFGSWSVYRPENGKFDISYIDPTLCTHLIYSFVGITEDGNVRVLDSWQDLADNSGKDGFGRFNKLRELSPGTKTMVAIGGWNEGSAKYSQVAGNPDTRRRFIDNVVAFVKKYGFNGFDVDWEYPNQRGGVPADKENYVSLLKELREKFDKEGLELSAAVAAAEVSASKSYNIAEVAKYLHFINLMAYDFHGAWDQKTGMNAPLYAGSKESENEKGLNVNASVNYWLKQGAPANKLVLGVPFYGRSFTLSNPSDNGMGAPANQPGTAGPYTREAGMLGYNEICEKLGKEHWTVVHQEEQRVPYAVNGNQWVGYDDERALKEKADFVKRLGLGGMMVWSVETDDFKGTCGAKYPLLNTINRELRNGVAPPASSNPKPTGSPTGSITSASQTATSAPTQPPVVLALPKSNPTSPPTSGTSAPQTTTSASTHPPAVPEGVCKTEGYVRDPQDCSVFYYCQNVNGRFVPSRFTCASGLVFDQGVATCNYRNSNNC